LGRLALFVINDARGIIHRTTWEVKYHLSIGEVTVTPSCGSDFC
jgi:hypothetical protein